MTKDELKEDLMKRAHIAIRDKNRTISPSAEAELRELISSGVDRMFDEDKHDNKSIELARLNANQFINEMCKKYRGRVIDRSTFSIARLSICPKWPFC